MEESDAERFAGRRADDSRAQRDHDGRASEPYPFPTVALPARHFVALTAVVIVFLAHRSAGTVIDEGGLFLLSSIAVLGSAWFAGTGSALSVTVLGAVLGSVVAGRDGLAGGPDASRAVRRTGTAADRLVAELRRRATDRRSARPRLANAARARDQRRRAG